MAEESLRLVVVRGWIDDAGVAQADPAAEVGLEGLIDFEGDFEAGPGTVLVEVAVLLDAALALFTLAASIVNGRIDDQA
ncbi:MAG: hypothetical protein R3F59_29065 [Myxococcota bacterium]